MMIQENETINTELNGNITYDGTLTKFYRDVTYLHKRTMLAVNSVLEAFPKGIAAEIQTSGELYSDIDYVDVFIHVRQEDHDAIWKTLIWALNFTKSRRIGSAGIDTELEFVGSRIYTSQKINFEYEIRIYVVTPLAGQLIQQFKAVETLRDSISSLSYEELLHHKTACEQRMNAMSPLGIEPSAVQRASQTLLNNTGLDTIVSVN